MSAGKVALTIMLVAFGKGMGVGKAVPGGTVAGTSEPPSSVFWAPTIKCRFPLGTGLNPEKYATKNNWLMEALTPVAPELGMTC